MVEKLLKGSPRYYLWLLSLLAFIGVAGVAYIYQLQTGLGVTGMNRDVSWGLYISQFTYFVGVAASAVMLVLPAYFHHYKKFKRMIIFGEFMAISAVVMCMLFIVADMGQPQRMLNVILHPTPNSVMFFDMLVLIGYLLLNVVIGWVTLEAERLDIDPPHWIKYLVYLSIIWAFSIHTVTAFLYAGLPGRHLWLTAVLAGRFLASAFCSGPAILLLLVLAVKRMTGFDPGQDAIKTLTKIITYAMCVNLFLFFCEVFTAFYSGIPGHQHPLVFLFAGHDGHISWVTPWMWACGLLAFAALSLLIPPALRDNMQVLPWALGMLIAASWIDKGLGLIIGGFSPNVFETLTPYAPTGVEILITLGVYAVGLLLLSLLWKIAIGVKQEAGTFELHEPRV
ncbi:MAG: polysulfide reductase NrfD [Deltaproteobacteria bacterium]|jgi:molybdopterin-containing oxidoreductase family membrane subunit|nr:polysulfide reductase NrfD [Deltaproteobacteria bacterium]